MNENKGVRLQCLLNKDLQLQCPLTEISTLRSMILHTIIVFIIYERQSCPCSSDSCSQPCHILPHKRASLVLQVASNR